MELEGKVWKDEKFWLAEVPSLNVMTQGKTRKEALFMIEDAITGLINCYFKEAMEEEFEIHINDYKDVIGITSTNTKLLMAFSLKRQRETMIRTEREYKAALIKLSQNEETLNMQREHLESMNLSREQIELVMSPLQSFYNQLKQEVEACDCSLA